MEGGAKCEDWVVTEGIGTGAGGRYGNGEMLKGGGGDSAWDEVSSWD